MALQDLFVRYLQDAPGLRDTCLDCDNITFHRENELRIKVPDEWDAANDVSAAIEKTELFATSILIFYSDTPNYRAVEAVFGRNPVKFHSFFELQCAIMDAIQDIRPQQRIAEEIKEANVVIIFDATRCSTVVLDAIRQFTNGSLILID